MDYKAYLKSEHWKGVKNKIYGKQPKCSICGTKKFLNIHHKTYKRLGREKLEDLQVLCYKCHKRHHFGIFDEYYEWRKKFKCGSWSRVAKELKPIY